MLPVIKPAASTGRPALRAGLAMLLAGGLVMAVAVLVRHGLGRPIDLRLALVLHGGLALALIWWWGLPWWWRIIGALFAPAVGLALGASLPGWAWGIGFVILAGLSWGAVVSRVPLFLSTSAVWAQVEALVPPGRVRVIDLGSGLGGFVLHLARQRPEVAVEGIELAPLAWLYGWLRARLTRSPARLRFGDYRRLDFGAYDLAFAFLSPAAMPDLWTQAAAGMRAGTVLVSCEFDIPGVPPARRIEVPGQRALLVWTMPGPQIPNQGD